MPVERLMRLVLTCHKVVACIRVLECFQLGKADLHSLDFTFNRLCMKLFKTGKIDVLKDSQSYFATDLPSCDLKRRQDKFILRYISTVNGFANFVKSCNT